MSVDDGVSEGVALGVALGVAVGVGVLVGVEVGVGEAVPQDAKIVTGFDCTCIADAATVVPIEATLTTSPL